MNYSLIEMMEKFSLRCSSCKQGLDVGESRCFQCHRPFLVEEGIPSFLDKRELKNALNDREKDKENAFLNFFKRWPTFYKWAVLIVVPIFYTGLTAEKFLSRFTGEEKLLNVGSGTTSLHPRILNVDLYKYSNVHVMANAERLPFADNTFDAVCTDQVMEHVAAPLAVAQEILRVTKPGGLIYTAAPFMYPYHPSPKDYSRWSVDGLAGLFAGHEAVESGVLIGPVSGMTSVLASGLAIVFSFGIGWLRKILHYVFMLLVTPFKFLDFFYARLPGAEETAGNMYVVIKK